MTQELMVHLSEEALDDVLIGMSSTESEAHLARCGECRAKVEAFGADVRLFNTTSLAWSEARNVQAQRRPQMTRGVPAWRMPYALVGSAAAAVLAVVAALSVGHHEGGFAPHEKGSGAVAVQDPQAQIAQDNQLMQAVNAAINADEASPIDEYGISNNEQRHRKAQPK